MLDYCKKGLKEMTSHMVLRKGETNLENKKTVNLIYHK